MTESRRAWILFGAGLAAALSFVGFAVWSRFPVPYRDDWDWLHWVLSGPVSPARLFQPHNEHLIPLPRLLLWLQFQLEGANGHLIFWLALACQASIVGLFLQEIATRWRGEPDLQRIGAGLTLLLLCFSWQLQSIVLVAAVLFPLVQLLGAIAVVAAVGGASSAGRRRRLWIGAAHVASLGAMLTTTNGLVVPITLAALAAGMRQGPLVIGSYLAGTAAGGVVYVTQVLAPGLPGPSAGIPEVTAGAIFVYFFAFFAPFMAYFSPKTAALAGGVLALAGGWIVASLLMRREHTAPRLEWTSAGLMLFVIGTALLAAVGRAALGVEQVAQSRYATYALVYWAALLLSAMSLATRSTRLAWLVRLAPVWRTGAIPVTVVFLVAHVASGLVWRTKAEHVDAAGLAIRADVPDEAWLTVLHPHPPVIRRVEALLEARADRRHIAPWIGRTLTWPEHLPVCHGALVLTRVSNQSIPTLRLSGDLRTTAARGLILDETGMVVGLARPAPAVDGPDVSHAAVIDAARAAFLPHAAAVSPWFGLARDCGSPCRFVATADDDTPICVVQPVPVVSR